MIHRFEDVLDPNVPPNLETQDAATNTTPQMGWKKITQVFRANGVVSTFFLKPTGEIVEVQHQKKNE